MPDGPLTVGHKIGRAKINRSVTTGDFFMGLTSKPFPIGLSGRPWAEFYHLLGQAEPLLWDESGEGVARKVISPSEEALAFRQYDLLDHASDTLLALPLPENYKTAALYYKQLCVQDLGRGYLDRAESLLGLVIESDDSKYRERALSSYMDDELTAVLKHLMTDISPGAGTSGQPK